MQKTILPQKIIKGYQYKEGFRWIGEWRIV